MNPLIVDIEVVGRQYFSLFGGELIERQINSDCADALKELCERAEEIPSDGGDMNEIEIGKLVSKLLDAAHKAAPETDMFTIGSMTEEDGDLILSYDESEVTGMEGASTVIRVGADGTVSLNRCGSVMTNLVFKKHERVVCAFENLAQPGMPVCVYTREMKIARTRNTGRVVIDYFVQIGGVNGEHDKIVVTWRPHKPFKPDPVSKKAPNKAHVCGNN